MRDVSSSCWEQQARQDTGGKRSALGSPERSPQATKNVAECCKDAYQAFGRPSFATRGCRLLVPPIAILDRWWHFVFPLEGMPDDFCLTTNDVSNAPVALRKPPAEFVDSGLRVDTYGDGVGANVGPREDTGWPAAEVVALHRLPEVDADLRALRNLFE